MRIEADQMWGYFEWLFDKQAILSGLLIGVGIGLLAFIVCYLISVAKYGPSEAFYNVTKVIYELLARDLPKTSFHRVYALARLAFQEAIRRKVLVVIGIFIVGVMFGGWFLDEGTSNVAQLYISFVMTATSYFVLLLGLFLSCFSLPADIKNKTIQTITTKPVRSTEIVLGRVLGFTAVGTLMLVVMGGLSYVFVIRSIKHEHASNAISADGKGTTTFDAKHSHTFTLNADKTEGVTEIIKGHRHVVRKDANGDYVLGEPEGLLQAKIPMFGKLQMTKRDGEVYKEEEELGLNVGYESNYHRFIEGAPKTKDRMSAFWTFKPVTPGQFQGGEELPIEMTLQAFRTYKGDIVTGVRGEIFLRNPTTGIETERRAFVVQEFSADTQVFKAKMPGFEKGTAREINIWEDICKSDWQVVVKCTDPGQYLGMSTADLYLRMGDSRFGWNFFKGFIGIWLQMFIMICLGVMFSTFLSGPVAMVATMSSLILGFFGTLAVSVYSGQTEGGGPIESMIRMPLHLSATVDLDLGNETLVKAIKAVDTGIMGTVSTMFQAIPSFGAFNTSEFVAYGYNIPGALLCRHITMAIGYFILTSLIGYFFLKTRELASA